MMVVTFYYELGPSVIFGASVEEVAWGAWR